MTLETFVPFGIGLGVCLVLQFLFLMEAVTNGFTGRAVRDGFPLVTVFVWLELLSAASAIGILIFT